MTFVTPTAPWGATPEEWARLADTLSLRADLLPVVSNPHAKISQRSKLRDLGKTPSRYDQAGEVVGIPKWTVHATTEHDIRRWMKNSDLGICVQTRNVRAIDIDIADPVAAQQVRDLIELAAGALPVRFRSSTGKCLLVFRMPGSFGKRIIRTEHGLIEFLATGQQFVAVGTHQSGSRYEWADSDGVIGLPAAVPEMSPAEFEALWQGLADALALKEDGASVTVRNGMVPAVPRRAGDMRDPVVAWLDENGHVREHERDGRVHITCPFGGEHTSDSGPSATTYFPAGVGGFDQGHFRCLHAHCAGRGDGDFADALGLSALVVGDFDDTAAQIAALPAVAGPPGAPLPAFTRDRSGRIEAELNNLLLALPREDLTGAAVARDTFKACTMWGEGGVWRRFTDTDYTRLRSMLERKGFKPVGADMMRHAVAQHAEDHQFDSAQQWADGLAWDGVPRVERFLSAYFSVADTPYARAVSRYLWTALAGRCLVPGCKADMVPVFVGAQGVGKTTAVLALAPTPDTFVEVDLTRKDDDTSRMLCGRLVGEIAELKGLHGRDSDYIKSFLSRTHEAWIEKWHTTPTEFGRRLLMIGTGNNAEFLDDETGERRWLPVAVGRVDVPGIEAARDQLWAEGVALFKAGGVAWADAQRLAVAEHGKFKITDIWHPLIERWLGRDSMDGESAEKRGDAPFTALTLLTSAVGISADRANRAAEMRVARVLRQLGYEQERVRVGNKQVRQWVKC
jgi:hypothetical protein